jgi:hypothetical protein
MRLSTTVSELCFRSMQSIDRTIITGTYDSINNREGVIMPYLKISVIFPLELTSAVMISTLLLQLHFVKTGTTETRS